MRNNKQAWEKSYLRGDNHVFYPHEEVIRFVSKYIRKRVGFNEFLDMASPMLPPPPRYLTLVAGLEGMLSTAMRWV